MHDDTPIQQIDPSNDEYVVVADFNPALRCTQMADVVMITDSRHRLFEFQRPIPVVKGETFAEYVKRMAAIAEYRGYARRLKGTNFWLATHVIREEDKQREPSAVRTELCYRLSRFLKTPVVVQFKEDVGSVCTSDGSGTCVQTLLDVIEPHPLSFNKSYFQAIWRLPTFRVLTEETLDQLIRDALDPRPTTV